MKKSNTSIKIPPFTLLYLGGALSLILLVITNLQNIQTANNTYAAENNLSLQPTDDAFVNKEFEGRNYGQIPLLRVDATPTKLSFLKFNLGQLQNGKIRSAKLFLKVDGNASKGQQRIKLVQNNSWSESTVTFKNKPDNNEKPLDEISGGSAGEWIHFDVTNTVQNKNGKVVSFVIRTANNNATSFYSKESEFKPYLAITFATNSTLAPTQKPTQQPDVPVRTPSPTPTTSPIRTPINTIRPSVTPTSRPIPTTNPTIPPNPTNVPNPPSTTFGAFPGAEGYGAQTKGGRGGKVIYVTSLNDSGAGTLREALETSGPRTVMFKVAGTITLSNDINIAQPFITIAGQSAPGEGVQIKGAMLKIRTHDIVIRYFKARIGDESNSSSPADRDAITMTGTHGTEVYNVIIDHSSLVWGPDIGGVAMLTDTHNVTIQNTILGEGLNLSNHPEGVPAQGGHSYGTNITALGPQYGSGYPRNITLYRNLLTTSGARMPQVQGGEFVDIVNNVIYNWGIKGPHGNPRKLNLVKNMLIKGPETTGLFVWQPGTNQSCCPTLTPGSVYEEGNVTEGFTATRGTPNTVYTANRFSPYSIRNEQSPQQAYSTVIANVGANRPLRDSADEKIIFNLIDRKGNFLNGIGKPAPNPQWPTLASGPTPIDSDNDGMADTWEQQNFGSLSQGSATNSSSDFDNDGYTDLEEYLNLTNPKAN
jgi:hypothetical protein